MDCGFDLELFFLVIGSTILTPEQNRSIGSLIGFKRTHLLSYVSGFKFTVADSSENHDHYTPGIYAEGYIVFVMPFVRMCVHSFVLPLRYENYAKVLHLSLSNGYISTTTHQKAFIRGS